MSGPTLAEALASIQYQNEVRPTDIDPCLLIVFAAARERLEMGEGEQVWWCEEHLSQSLLKNSGRCYFVHCHGNWKIDPPCRMVPARLYLDKGET